MTPRITVPNDQHPTLYATTQAGSPTLVRNRLQSYEAAYYNDSTLTPRERDMARMRSVYEVDCNLCAATRGENALPGYEDIPDELYEHVLDWRTWDGFTCRERLAIEFAERYILDCEGMCDDDDLWARLKSNFDDAEVADLCILMGHWESSRRMLKLLVGSDNACEITVDRGGDSFERMFPNQAGNVAATP
jgi:alkylhydroperoxidase family enzyme